MVDTALALAVAALTWGTMELDSECDCPCGPSPWRWSSARAFVTVALNYVVFGTAWILGDSVRTHRAYAAELEERAASAERRRLEEARRAAAEERVRMARELHDVVAHHVSLIAVQSEAAQVLLPEDPARAAEAVGAIGTTGRRSSSGPGSPAWRSSPASGWRC